MSDQPTETTPPDTTTEPQGDPDGLGDAGKRAIAAERAARQQAEQQLKSLTEQFEAATARAAAFEAANNDLTGTVTSKDRELERLKVGLAKKLPAELIDRLRGDDQASLEADADALLAFLPQTVTSSTPRPDPSQGSRGPATPDPATQFANALMQARNRS